MASERRGRPAVPTEPAGEAVDVARAGEGFAISGKVEPALAAPEVLEAEVELAARGLALDRRIAPHRIMTLNLRIRPVCSSISPRSVSQRPANVPGLSVRAFGSGRQPFQWPPRPLRIWKPPVKAFPVGSSVKRASPLAWPSSYSNVRTLPFAVPLRGNWPFSPYVPVTASPFCTSLTTPIVVRHSP